MPVKRHFPEVTIARGLTMLLVIIGHAFPDGDRAMASFFAQMIHHTIYLFHMGAFIFIAGFVAAPRILAQSPILPELRKRFSRLMIPYFCWTLVLVLLKQVFGMLAREPFSLGDSWKLLIGAEHLGWLWYLFALFIISAIFLLLSRFTVDHRIFLGIGIALHIVWFFFPEMYLDRVAKYAIFFALGIWLRPRYDKLLPLLRTRRATLIAAVIILLKPFLQYPYVVTGCAGTLLIWQLACRMADKQGRACAVFTEIGNRSYDIYLLGYYVQVPARIVLDRILHVPYWPQVILCAVLGVIVPYLLSRYIVPRMGILRRIFLGYAQ